MKNRNLIKLGGVSLRNARAICSSVTNVLNEGSTEIAVSAPGVDGDEPKMTDAVIANVIPNLQNGNIWEKHFKPILDRFAKICKGLEIENEFFKSLRKQTIKDLVENKYEDFVKSYPERLTALIIVKWLCNQGYNAKFLDPMETIFLKKDGIEIDLSKSQKAINNLGKGKCIFILAGYQVMGFDGKVKTLERDGTDISGAVYAYARRSKEYCLGKDVLGIYTGDPRIVKNWKVNPHLTDVDTRNLTYAGTNAVHTKVIEILAKRKIPIRVYNPNIPGNEGTLITFDSSNDRPIQPLAITGKGNFISFKLVRRGMNDQVGALRKMCSVFERLGISFEHVPTGIDESLFIVDKGKFNVSEKLDKLIAKLQKINRGGVVTVIDCIAVIAVVSTRHDNESERIVQNVLRNQSIEPFYLQQMGGLILMAVLDLDLEKLIRLFHKDLFEETDPQPHQDSGSVSNTQIATKERWQEI